MAVKLDEQKQGAGKNSPPDEGLTGADAGVPQTLDASKPIFAPGEISDSAIARRLSLFYELALRFGEETQLDSLLQVILERVIEVIPSAKRGALLVRDQASGKVALKAHLPVGRPAVSLTMAQRAMEQRQAFIWPPQGPPPGTAAAAGEADVSPSVVEHKIASAMYVPLLWRGETLGVICVDNCETGLVFQLDDLRLLQAVAHHAALAVTNLQLQEKWRRQTETQSKILKLISPQLAERLTQQRGRIRLGGEFRDATILLSDIRGFTNLSATMEPDDVAEMLEDYFGKLTPLVSQNHGLIDKFVGDAILAVFGSPDRDEQQHLHAVRTGMEMQAAMKEVNAVRAARGKRTGELGIGIHYGEVVHGFIGSPDRMEFTVIGDTVNRASRYCDGARGGEVLVSPEVYQWIWRFVEAELTSIETKHEGNFVAYRIKQLKSARI